MEWHPILSSGSARSPLHPSLCSRHNASPWGGSQPEHSLKNTAQKGLDSDALDQPTIWHVQNTQSRSHFRSETNHTQKHSPRRRRTPDTDVPSDPKPDQLSARVATLCGKHSEPQTEPRKAG